MFHYPFNTSWDRRYPGPVIGNYYPGCDPYFDDRWQEPYSGPPTLPSNNGASYDYGYGGHQPQGYDQNVYPPYYGPVSSCPPGPDYNHNVLLGGQDAYPREKWFPPVQEPEPQPLIEGTNKQEAKISRSPPSPDGRAKKRSSSPPPRRRSRSPPLRPRNRPPSPPYRQRSPPPPLMRLRTRSPPRRRRRSPPWCRGYSPPRFERFRPRSPPPPPLFRSRSSRPRGRSPKRRLSRSPRRSRSPPQPKRARSGAERPRSCAGLLGDSPGMAPLLRNNCNRGTMQSSFSNPPIRSFADVRIKELSMNAIARYRSRSKSPMVTRSSNQVETARSARGHVSSKEKRQETLSKRRNAEFTPLPTDSPVANDCVLDKDVKKSERDENVVPPEVTSEDRPNICPPNISKEKCITVSVKLESSAAAHTLSLQVPPQASTTNIIDSSKKETILNVATQVAKKSSPILSVSNQSEETQDAAVLSAEPAPSGVKDPCPSGSQEKCTTESVNLKSSAAAYTTPLQVPPQASPTNHVDCSGKEAILNRTTQITKKSFPISFVSKQCEKTQDAAVISAEPVPVGVSSSVCDPAQRKQRERKRDAACVVKDPCPSGSQEKRKTESVNLKSSSAVHTSAQLTKKSSSSKVSVQSSSKSELPALRRNSQDSDKQNSTAMEKNPSGSPLYQPSFNKSFKIPKKGNTSPVTGTASSNVSSESGNVQSKVLLHQTTAKQSERLPNPLLEPRSVSQPVIQNPKTWLQYPTQPVKKILLTRSPGRIAQWRIDKEKRNEDVIATLEGRQEVNLSEEVEIARRKTKEEEKRRQQAELEESAKKRRLKEEEEKLRKVKEDKRKQELKPEESKKKKHHKDEKHSKKVKEQNDKKGVDEVEKTSQETCAEKKMKSSSSSKLKKNGDKVDETKKGCHKTSNDEEGLKKKKEEEVKKKSRSKGDNQKSKERKKEVKSKQDENRKRKREGNREERKKEDGRRKKAMTKRDESPEWTPNRRSPTPGRRSSTPGRRSSTPGRRSSTPSRRSRTPRRCKTPDSTTPFVPSGVASRTRSRTGSPSAKKSANYSNCFSDSDNETDEPFTGWDDESITNWMSTTLPAENTIIVSLTQENYVSIENWHKECSTPVKSAALTAIAQSYTPTSPSPSTCSTPPLPASHCSIDCASALRTETETTPLVSTNVSNEINSSSTISIPADVVQANVVSSCSTPAQGTLPTCNSSDICQEAKETELIDITEEVGEMIWIKKRSFKDGWNALLPLMRQKIEKLTDAFQLARSSIDNFIKNYREREKVRTYQFRATELKKLKIDFVKSFNEYFERSIDLKSELTLDFKEEDLFFLLDEKVVRDYGRKGDSKDTLLEMEYLHSITTGQKKIMDEPPEKKPTSHAFIAAGILLIKPLNLEDVDYETDRQHTFNPVELSIPRRSAPGITRLPSASLSENSSLNIPQGLNHEGNEHAQSEANLKLEGCNEQIIEEPIRQISYNRSDYKMLEDVLDLSQRTRDRIVGSTEPANNQQPENQEEDVVKVPCICCPDRARVMCSGCYSAWYCSSECQASHWEEVHKMNCQAARQ